MGYLTGLDKCNFNQLLNQFEKQSHTLNKQQQIKMEETYESESVFEEQSKLPYKLPQCSEHPQSQVTLVCTTATCPFFSSQKLFCPSCNVVTRHNHVTVTIASEVTNYFGQWQELLAKYDISNDKIDTVVSDYNDMITQFDEILKGMKKTSRFLKAIEVFKGYRSFTIDYFHDFVKPSIEENDVIKLSDSHYKNYCGYKRHLSEEKMKFLEQSPIVMLWNFYFEIIDVFQLQPLLEELNIKSINVILRFKLQKIQQQVDLLESLQKKQLPGPIKLTLIENDEFNSKVEHTLLLNKINSLLPSDLKMADISIIDRVRSELDTIGVIGMYVSQRVQMDSKFDQQAKFFKEIQEGRELRQSNFKEQVEQLVQQNKLLEEQQLNVQKQNQEKQDELIQLIKKLQDQQTLIIKENQEGLQQMKNIFSEQFEQLHQQNKLLEEKQKEFQEQAIFQKEKQEFQLEQSQMLKECQDQHLQEIRMLKEQQEKQLQLQASMFKEQQDQQMQLIMKRLDEQQLAFEKIYDKKIAENISKQIASIKVDFLIKEGAGTMPVSNSSSVDTSVSQLCGEPQLFSDSLILSDNAKRSTMIGYFAQMDISNFTVSLLYRASRDGFGAEDFHKTCDKKGATITIVQTTTDHVIGGYTNDPWHSSGGCKQSLSGWLFSFAHAHPFKRAKGDGNGIWCMEGKGACFGKGNIAIESDSDRNEKSWVHANGRAYEFGGVHLLNGKGKGETYFTTKEIEVYLVN
ncbi:hypothetical protein FGO68_gene9601 [Halteria grandinella]|uniref:TLDc domain-containing protein n=1 Tax=Halteria grandinella TaxID=5974 RepID=A0A8J8T6C2_HALGN|nr:hypothetical protein FGO68_gene9601 [Halteria grandinella]